jgi:small subunit ribosomal protein S6
MEERLYDLIFIVRPDTPETDIDKLITTIEHSIAEKGATVDKLEKWGRKRMAYRVHKLREGFYVYFALRSTNGELVKELERRLKVNDSVIKYLTVRLDEDMKRKEKFNKRRERRAARRLRKNPPVAAAPVPVAPPAASNPALPPAAVAAAGEAAAAAAAEKAQASGSAPEPAKTA